MFDIHPTGHASKIQAIVEAPNFLHGCLPSVRGAAR